MNYLDAKSRCHGRSAIYREMTKLTDEQAIRKGVELAGWTIYPTGFVEAPWCSEPEEWQLIEHLPKGWIAALAADLVELVDGMDEYVIQFDDELEYGKSHVSIYDLASGVVVASVEGKGRRLNTIHAVVAFYEAQEE